MTAAEASSGGVSQDSIDAMLAAARAKAEEQAAEGRDAGASADEAPEAPIGIDAVLGAEAPGADAAALPEVPQGPMSLADRLAAMGMSVPSDSAEAEPDVEEAGSGGLLSQAAIDAMRARASAEAEPVEEEAGSGGLLSQAAIDAMRARASAEAEPVVEEAGSGGLLSQAAIDAMRARASAQAEPAEATDSMEISLEELLSAGVTPGKPLPGAESLSSAAIEALLNADGATPAEGTMGGGGDGDGVEISLEELLAAGIKAVPRGPRPPRAPKERAAPVPEPMAEAPAEPAGEEPPNLRLMMDVSLELTAEIGSISMAMDDLLSLYAGTILSLNTHAEEPVKLLANGLPLALGEVIVVEEKFGVRVIELVKPAAFAL